MRLGRLCLCRGVVRRGARGIPRAGAGGAVERARAEAPGLPTRRGMARGFLTWVSALLCTITFWSHDHAPGSITVHSRHIETVLRIRMHTSHSARMPLQWAGVSCAKSFPLELMPFMCMAVDRAAYTEPQVLV